MLADSEMQNRHVYNSTFPSSDTIRAVVEKYTPVSFIIEVI